MNFTHRWLSKRSNYGKHCWHEGRIRGTYSSHSLFTSHWIASGVSAGFPHRTVCRGHRVAATSKRWKTVCSGPTRHVSAGASQPPSASKTGLALSLCNKIQQGEQTAVEEVLLQNNKGECVLGRRRVTVHEKKIVGMNESKKQCVLTGKSVSTLSGCYANSQLMVKGCSAMAVLRNVCIFRMHGLSSIFKTKYKSLDRILL